MIVSDEKLLQFIWQFKLFDTRALATSAGVPVQIISSGTQNFDAGPDFFNARIKIGNTLWAGNVEVHPAASGWEAHGHDKDPAYDNVILHVVLEADAVTRNTSGSLIPVLPLYERIDKKCLAVYKNIMTSGHKFIPCASYLQPGAPGSSGADHKPDNLTWHIWVERMMGERLQKKTRRIQQSLRLNKNNWEAAFYEHLARAFGYRTNGEPFQMLARSLPVKILSRHKPNLQQLEALLFGQAGMLGGNLTGDYPRELKREYRFLAAKYSLTPIDFYLWKFARLRPANFPTIRLAQFAALVHRSSHLFSRILETGDIREIRKYFSVKASAYWNTHYLFDKSSASREKRIGERSVDLLLINVVIPFLFCYGKAKGIEGYTDRAFTFLEKMKPENNKIVQQFVNLGVIVENSLHSQGLLQLKAAYCNKKRCLSCAIGTKILKQHVAENHQLY